MVLLVAVVETAVVVFGAKIVEIAEAVEAVEAVVAPVLESLVVIRRCLTTSSTGIPSSWC